MELTIKSFGKRMFQLRDYTPIPIILFILAVANPGGMSFGIGLIVVVLGELVRFYGVWHIGSISRTRTDAVGGQLISNGPFAIVRNPLYIGNLLICMGLVLFSGAVWFLPLFLCLFFFQYHPIVLWEEENLLSKFGSEYREYLERVPRWFPDLEVLLRQLASVNAQTYRLLDDEKKPDFVATLRSERNTLAAIVVLLVLFALR